LRQQHQQQARNRMWRVMEEISQNRGILYTSIQCTWIAGVQLFDVMKFFNLAH